MISYISKYFPLACGIKQRTVSLPIESDFVTYEQSKFNVSNNDIVAFPKTSYGFYEGSSILPTSVRGITFKMLADNECLMDQDWFNTESVSFNDSNNELKYILIQNEINVPEYLKTFKSVTVDCSLFVQIIYNSFTDKCGGIYYLPLYRIFFDTVDGNTDTLRYIKPKNSDAWGHLTTSTCNSKGQFVIKIGKDDMDNNLYLGLTSEGVVIGTFELYRNFLKRNIEKWVTTKGTLETDSIDGIMKSIIEIYLVQNKLDEWEII